MGGEVGSGTRVSYFFTGRGEGAVWGGEGTRVSDVFTKNPNLKTNTLFFIFLGGCGGSFWGLSK